MARLCVIRMFLPAAPRCNELRAPVWFGEVRDGAGGSGRYWGGISKT